MKNIHLIPVEESNLWFYEGSREVLLTGLPVTRCSKIDPQYIYITRDDVIKGGLSQWYLDKFLNKPVDSGGAEYASTQQIIEFTTDPQLIEDGVNLVPEYIINWFRLNPECEWLDIRYSWNELGQQFCDIIIPSREVNLDRISMTDLTQDEQELINDNWNYLIDSDTSSPKIVYTEEEVGEILYNVIGEYGKYYGIMIDGAVLNDLFNQFKK